MDHLVLKVIEMGPVSSKPTKSINSNCFSKCKNSLNSEEALVQVQDQITEGQHSSLRTSMEEEAATNSFWKARR